MCAALSAVSLALWPAGAEARSGHGRVQAAAAVPAGFVGVNAGGSMLSAGGGADLGAQFDAMVGAGVQTVRVVFSWADAQPYPPGTQLAPEVAARYVDIAGVPTDFSATDRIVAAAAQRHLRVLPTVMYAPGWDAVDRAPNLAIPADNRFYAAFLTGLIGRYGPRGSFWSGGGPRMPIRAWQVWNEPNLSPYWPQPSLRSYLALLRAAHTAIRQADPGARTVLGAITNRAWRYLRAIYSVRGARRWFDVLAVNTYTATPRGVITILRFVRQTADHRGDRAKPLLATEVGWTSARDGECGCQLYIWDLTQAAQAQKLSALLPLLGRYRTALKLTGFFYYTWADDSSEPNYDFGYAGLMQFLSGQLSPKPALSSFTRSALALERCRAKGTTADVCLH